MSDYFIYGGVNSATFLARVFPTDSMLKAPARNYNTVTVPGRSGALLMDLAAFDNLPREYDVQIVGDSELAAFIALRNYLASCSGYLRLTDSFDTTHYYMAAYTEVFGLTADYASMGRARGTITFDCKPQRFLLTGETERVILDTGTITNPTRFPSKPMLRVYGEGVLGIGSTNITIAAHGCEYIDIDCETGRACCGAVALDDKVTLNAIDYPSLLPGVNGVSMSGVTRAIITPRWWEI